RYNSQTNKFEGYQAGSWQDILTGAGGAAGPDRSVQFNSGGLLTGSAEVLNDVGQFNVNKEFRVKSSSYIPAKVRGEPEGWMQIEASGGRAGMMLTPGNSWNTWIFTAQNASHSLDILANGGYVNGSGYILSLDGSASGNITMHGTGSLRVPAGSTAERPTGTNGMLRYNSQTNKFEGYQAGSWQDIVTGAASSSIDSLTDAITNYTSGNMFLGQGNGDNITTGIDNTALGNAALDRVTTARYNTALGSYALTQNLIGDFNTSVGYAALQNNTSDANVALGYRALRSNTSGASNVAIGYMAMDAHTTGSDNIAIGYMTSVSNPAGNYQLNIGNLITGTLNAGLMQINGTGALTLPVGTTANRPTGATGMLRYNSTTGKFEGYQAGAWQDILTGAATSTFLSLTDTPSSYTAQGGKFVRVNSGATALEFTDEIIPSVAGQPAPTNMILDDLGDVVVSTPANGQSLVYNGSQWVNGSVTPSAAGPDRGVQFNSGGSFAATSNFTVSANGDVIMNSTTYHPLRVRSDTENWMRIESSGGRAGMMIQPGNTSNYWIFSTHAGSHKMDILANSGNVNAGGEVLSLEGGSAGLITMHGTGSLRLPSGTTAQRPTGSNGMIRYNSQTAKFEGYQAGSWQDIVTGAAGAAGSNTQLQFNSNGSFGAVSNLTWTNGTQVLGVTGSVNVSNRINIAGQTAAAPVSSLLLSALGDVSISAPATGQLLRYNGTTWGNATNLTWNSNTLAITGDLTYTGTITDVSDMRLKKDIQPLNGRGSMLEKLGQIGTYSYTMKADEQGRVEFGVMAQEINKVFPELVKVDDSTAEKYMSVNYVGMIAPLIEASKELKAENDQLKAQINTIEARMASLEGDMNGMKVHTGYGISKAQMGLGMMLGMMLMGGMAGAVMLVVNRRRRQG
ncbi:MAG TPA: tail fiber domain-containing protein, partial [Micavibrio sp.]